jgi:3-dehydroquinate synthetase
LPDRERKSGWGELVKYGGLNEGILRKIEEYLSGKTQDLLPLITACVAYKVGVVTRDEKEQGERKSLNLGHTTAHALELNFALSHGESVLYGLALETLLAIRLGVCERSYGERFLAVIKEVLKSEPYQKLDLSSVEDWTKNAKMDKKNTQGFIVLTLVKGANEWTTQAFDFERYVAEMKKSVYELWGEER